jgi:hypothetical protein
MMTQSAFFFEPIKMRRAESPVTMRLSRHDMHVEMRDFLAAAGGFQVQQGWHVTAWNYRAPADFELVPVQQRHRHLACLDDLPLVCIAVCDFTEKAWVAVWHLEILLHRLIVDESIECFPIFQVVCQDPVPKL